MPRNKRAATIIRLEDRSWRYIEFQFGGFQLKWPEGDGKEEELEREPTSGEQIESYKKARVEAAKIKENIRNELTGRSEITDVWDVFERDELNAPGMQLMLSEARFPPLKILCKSSSVIQSAFH